MWEFSKAWGRRDKTDWGMKYFAKDTANVAELRIADQINFFNKRSQQNQTKFKYLKGLSYLAAAGVTLSPVLASTSLLPIASSGIVATLGAMIIFIDRILTMNDCRGNWLSYRQTCEELRHEKHMYLNKVGPYLGLKGAQLSGQLALRTEWIIHVARKQWLEVRMGEEQFDKKIASPMNREDFDADAKSPGPSKTP